MAYRDQFKNFVIETFVGETLVGHVDYDSFEAAQKAFNEREVSAEEEIQWVTETGEIVATYSLTEKYRAEIFFR